ncbi:hypothetical protein IWW34DRAFT_216806 [Fusarium oxysporum f. sp. albedinis]|nr:hypothetical protein IWW34DRAFT_418231 [Fusarium oxysporum f. sp. albedinis]KAI3572828.1 hypothetical protein IWW34DRAFT_216806 [Fusarium oxysporum f. sp. albedinis]
MLLGCYIMQCRKRHPRRWLQQGPSILFYLYPVGHIMALLAVVMSQDNGGKKCAGLDGPRGCSMKRRISIPQVMLTIAGLLGANLTTWMPWTTLRTDWAGAKTLPASVMEIPNIPTISSIAFAMPLFSSKS